MRLYIVRHAWAYEFGDPRWPDDSQRPLERDGAERMARVVEQLAKRGFDPAIIATSPYVRCVQTAEVIAAGVGGKPKIVELAALRPGSNFEALAAWSDERAELGSICWVGHAPDVGRLTAIAVGDGNALIRFAKGTAAAIRCEVDVGACCGELEWLVTAKALGV